MPDVPELFICDWSNIVHRAYHGMGAFSDLLAPDIVRAAHNITLETALTHCYVGTRVVFVLDGGYSHRKQIYPEYKANRVATEDRPPALVTSLEGALLKDPYYSWRGTPIQMFGYESDDIMIGLAREHAARGGRAFIFSTDGDMLQAVESRITVLRPRKYPEPPDIYDVDKILEVYGFPPSGIPHYKALQGDDADNIPRIPRVGHGTACKLVREYTTIHGVIRAAMEQRLTPVVSRNIVEYKSNIFLNMRLVMPIEIPNLSVIYEGIMARPPSIV
jgi:DNA polymerase-1